MQIITQCLLSLPPYSALWVHTLFPSHSALWGRRECELSCNLHLAPKNNTALDYYYLDALGCKLLRKWNTDWIYSSIIPQEKKCDCTCKHEIWNAEIFSTVLALLLYSACLVSPQFMLCKYKWRRLNMVTFPLLVPSLLVRVDVKAASHFASSQLSIHYSFFNEKTLY